MRTRPIRPSRNCANNGKLPVRPAWPSQALSELGIERALLRHRYGRLLYARGNRRDAVDYLRAAHELFAGVGAEPYRQAVADDLASRGIRTATKQSPLDFTEPEQDVVASRRELRSRS